MICEQQAVVLADTTHLRQALVAVEEEFLAHVLQLLRFFGQHVPKSLLFVQEQFLFSSDKLILVAFKAPS